MITNLILCLFGFVCLAHGESNACTKRPEGQCMDVLSTKCPSGHVWTFNGCGFMEMCCYKYVENATKFEYGNSQCGVDSWNSNTRIVGGSVASILEFPWMASIQKFNRHSCGGSIVGDQWILTAAHCVVKNTRNLRVVVGSTFPKSTRSTFKKVHYVSKILLHPTYDDDVYKSPGDIALLKLHRKLDLGTSTTRSICLPDKGQSFADRVCKVTGWGHKEEPDKSKPSSSSFSLQAASLPVIKDSLCQYYNGKMINKTLCAGYRKGGVDSCQGDSGGPLICQEKSGKWVQAGIVSSGKGCARQLNFGVYTDVSDYRPWIDYVMENL